MIFLIFLYKSLRGKSKCKVSLRDSQMWGNYLRGYSRVRYRTYKECVELKVQESGLKL